MKRLEILTLTAQNFKSIGPEIKIDFSELKSLVLINGVNEDVSLADVGNVPIEVRNGAGKTTIIDAIVFSLFGRTLKGTENRYIPNRSFKKSAKTFCRLAFKIDGVEYESEAKMAAKNVSMSFKKDGKPIGKTTPETKKMVEEALGCNFDLFKSSVIVSSSDYINFYDLKKGKKSEYLEELFNLTYFGELLKAVRADANQIRASFDADNIRLAGTISDLSVMRQRDSTFQEQREKRITSIKEAIVIKHQAYNQCKDVESKEDTSEAQQKLSEELLKLMESDRKLSESENTLNRQLGEALASLNQQQDVYKLLCLDCMDKVDKAFNRIEKIQLADACQAKLDALMEAHEKIRKKLSAAREEASELARQNARSKMMSENAITLWTDIASLSKMLKDAVAEQNPYGEIIAEAERKAEDLRKSLSERNGEIREMEALEFAFGEEGVKRLLLNELTEIINKRIQNYLSQLGAKYTVRFDQSFEPTFITPDGESDLTSFSGGERQRINIATMFTLRDLIIGDKLSCNLFIIDEVFDDKIDAYALGCIIKILKTKMVANNHKTLVISHNQNLIKMGNFEQILEVTKRNGISKYELKNVEKRENE